MTAQQLVVFDCNVLLQIMLGRGPAEGCFEHVRRGELLLVVSPYVLDELRKMLDHRDLKRFVQLTHSLVEDFVDEILRFARLEQQVPEVFTYERDPDDAHYVNLAVKAGAMLIVSRDRDLLDLGDTSKAAGRQFASRFPQLRIMQPVQLLDLLEGRQRP